MNLFFVYQNRQQPHKIYIIASEPGAEWCLGAWQPRYQFNRLGYSLIIDHFFPLSLSSFIRIFVAFA